MHFWEFVPAWLLKKQKTITISPCLSRILHVYALVTLVCFGVCACRAELT